MLSHILCATLTSSAARRHADFSNASTFCTTAQAQALATTPVCTASYARTMLLTVIILFIVMMILVLMLMLTLTSTTTRSASQQERVDHRSPSMAHLRHPTSGAGTESTQDDPDSVQRNPPRAAIGRRRHHSILPSCTSQNTPNCSYLHCFQHWATNMRHWSQFIP